MQTQLCGSVKILEDWFQVNFAHAIDISMPLRHGEGNPKCFWAPEVEYLPVTTESFVGSIAQGGIVNFFNIRVNPHGNGTHTECVGHISKEPHTIQDCLKAFMFSAKLVTVHPKQVGDDWVIERAQLADVLQKNEVQAIIIRTLPNDDSKLTRNYSGTNPPYIHHEAMQYIVDCGVVHFLIDLPSVDREDDGAQFMAHKAFWQYPENTRVHSTITELVYVPNAVADGYYLLNIQIGSYLLDASPSKPVLYPIEMVTIQPCKS